LKARHLLRRSGCQGAGREQKGREQKGCREASENDASGLETVWRDALGAREAAVFDAPAFGYGSPAEKAALRERRQKAAQHTGRRPLGRDCHASAVC